MNDNWKLDFEKRLRAVDWASVNHAFGPATEVPDELMTFLELGILSQANGDDFAFFYRSLSHQCTRYPATLVAVPFLAEMAEHAPRNQNFLVDYLVEVALGHQRWHCSNGFCPERAQGSGMTQQLTSELYAAVEEHAFPVFLRLAKQSHDLPLPFETEPPILRLMGQRDDPKTQKMALRALGWFPNREHESRPVLEANLGKASRCALLMLDAAIQQSPLSDEEVAGLESMDEIMSEIYN